MMLFAFLLAQAAPPPPTKAEIDAVRTMHVVAKCLASRHADDARKVLALDFRSRGYKQALPELARLGGHCAKDELGRAKLRSPGLTFAGSIAEALLERDGVLTDFAARTGYRPDLPGIDARVASEFMAFCTIRKDPAGTAALLRADPAGAEEASAFSALRPTLAGCVPANSKFEFDQQSVRALLALGAWRLAMHNAGAAPSKPEAAR